MEIYFVGRESRFDKSVNSLVFFLVVKKQIEQTNKGTCHWSKIVWYLVCRGRLSQKEIRFEESYLCRGCFYLVMCLYLGSLVILNQMQTKHDPLICVIMRNKKNY